ncbi:MAG: integrase [Devosia sp.]
MRRAAPAKPHNRDGIWYLIRKVPKAFQDFDKRVIVRLSTEIRVADDPRAVRAKSAVRDLDIGLGAYWRGLKDGQENEARRRFEEAQRRARDLNLSYLTNQEIAGGPVEDMYRRLELLVSRGSLDDEAEVAAVMGGEAKPRLMLSQLYAEFEALMEPSLERHSPNQRRKWGQKYKRAVKALSDALGGDKALVDLTRADGVAFRLFWQNRLKADLLDIGTANKQIGHIATMLKEVELVHQLDIKCAAFTGLTIRGQVNRSRKPFAAPFVQKTILADGALDKLNAQARAIIWIEADTGARPVEICNLLPETIFLDAPIPFIRVRSIDRVLKTVQSERDLPLVGGALVAMRLFPAGFPRYHDNEGSLSALVNKFLSAHKMRPEPGQSNYSFRHCFEDRLTAVEAPEKVMASLMGHKFTREKYGDGPSLEQKLLWLEKIAFTPPTHFGPRG